MHSTTGYFTGWIRALSSGINYHCKQRYYRIFTGSSGEYTESGTSWGVQPHSVLTMKCFVQCVHMFSALYQIVLSAIIWCFICKVSYYVVLYTQGVILCGALYTQMTHDM